jgi:hypothetical protein
MGSFYEPWRAIKSPTWECSFRTPPPDDEPEAKAVWEEDRDKACRNAEYLIWGTGVWESGFVKTLTYGESVHVDSAGIIVTVRRVMTKDGRLDAQAFAQRIAACVNFCEGVDLSETGFSSLRELLCELRSLRDGTTRSLINELWRPKIEPEPVVFAEKGPPQGTTVKEPYRPKRRVQGKVPKYRRKKKGDA